MISSTLSDDGKVRYGTPFPGPVPGQKPTEDAGRSSSEFARQPKIRPEVLARARALVADPTYPSMDVLRKVAEKILSSPELRKDDH
jgi:hypothetical protein